MHLPIACPKDQQRISNRFLRISVIQVKVQHIPVNDKPHVANAGEQNYGIPELCPPPNVMISPGADGCDKNQKQSRGPQHPDNLEQMNAQVEFLTEVAGIVAGDHQNYAEDKDQVQGADQAYPQPSLHGGGLNFKPVMIMAANKGAGRPEQQREDHHYQAANNERHIEAAIVPKGGVLVYHSGEIGRKLKMVAGITTERQQLLAVHCAIEKRLHFLPLF